MAKGDFRKSVISLYAGKPGEEYNSKHLSKGRMSMMDAAKKVLYPLERKVILCRVIRSRWSAKKVSTFLKMDIREVNKHEKNALEKLMDYAIMKGYEADMRKMEEFSEEMQKKEIQRHESGYYVENYGPSYPLNELGQEANKYLEDRLNIFDERNKTNFSNDILEIIKETFVVRDYHRKETPKSEMPE
jgi:hypothetical protein